MRFEINAIGHDDLVFSCEADTPQEALKLFENGECGEAKEYAGDTEIVSVNDSNGNEWDYADLTGNKPAAPPYAHNKLMILSTAHLTEEAARLPRWALMDCEYGILTYSEGFYLGYENEEGAPRLYTNPDCVIEVMRYAKAEGYDRVLFDRDADQIAALPVYEW